MSQLKKLQQILYPYGLSQISDYYVLIWEGMPFCDPYKYVHP